MHLFLAIIFGVLAVYSLIAVLAFLSAVLDHLPCRRQLCSLAERAKAASTRKALKQVQDELTTLMCTRSFTKSNAATYHRLSHYVSARLSADYSLR